MRNNSPKQKDYRIGFVSTRFSGIDGVSLETRKWAAVFERLGHTCFYFGGSSDMQPERSFIVPEALFLHPDIRTIYFSAFTRPSRPAEITRMISDLKDHLKSRIAAFIRDFEIDVIVAENSLTIPMNIPLGIALTEFIAEESFPTIAHHHDFYWERQRYLMNCVHDYLSMAFPPQLPTIHHVVINSLAATQLSLRIGVSAMLVPNVMDFDHPPAEPGAYVSNLHQGLGLQSGERLILQPTRVVQRKGIEHAIELLKRLGLSARLVISHASGDELDEYEKRVHDYAQLMGVPVSFVSDVIRHDRGLTEDGRKIYALEDVYLLADLITYPSTIEGFGNAFLESIYYRRPIVVNAYSIYDIDIKPKGFKVIEFEGYITDYTVKQTRKVLGNPQLAQDMTEHNYELGKRYYSYAMLERHLNTLLSDSFGETL